MDLKCMILLALAAGSLAGPAGRRSPGSSAAATCSQHCTASSKFSYAPGTTYEFKYEVETKTAMLGASEAHATIGVTAKAHVEVHSKCEFVLRLGEVAIFGYDSQSYSDQDQEGQFKARLEEHPLHFSFQDGQIESVCPDEHEVSWVLNFKKGVLSGFQNTMQALDKDHKGQESDVSGNCNVEYEVAQKGWLSLTIKKIKDLDSCSNRHGYESAIQTTPFRISSGLKALPLTRSTYECDQEINTKGSLTSSVCHELQLFRPFSKETSGASTETTQKLTFIQQRDGVSDVQGAGREHHDLFFEHAQGEPQTDQGAREAMALLRELCVSTEADIRPETPRQFSSLVYLMKKMEYSGLKRIYNQVKGDKLCPNNPKTQKFAMDAFPMVGTAASVKLMKELLSDDVITGPEADMWLASMAFIHHPTKEMLGEIQQLLGLPPLTNKVLLPLSSLVHSYCLVNPECEDVTEVRDVVESLRRNIPPGCTVNEQNYKTVMLTLRAIGNAGHSQMVIPALGSCIGNSDNPMDIRISSAEAFRRLSCGADRNNLMSVFRNDELDSELRIAAYLGVMKCPNSNFIAQIAETLKTEEVNQVGSFVWTHLTNLMESSDPGNKYVQSLLTDDLDLKDFDLDKRKFSRNYEGSFFIEKFNTGAKVDSNLVWSSSSFIPRSASLNLTFDLFGKSMNLFEVGGRVEGLEFLLEKYFGPSGYFKDSAKSADVTPLADPRPASLSARKMNSIHNKVESRMDELRGALYTRMFGNELSYTMFGSQADNSVLGFSLFDFMEKLRRNEKQNIALTKSIMFLDSSIILPSLAGFPLNLTVNGTASVSVKATGHMDFKKPASNIIIEGSFEPSGAVEIQSMMSVDAYVTRAGMKMVSTLHTSTGAKAKIELANKQVLDMTFDLTKEKSEILDVKNAFFMVYQNVEKEQKMIQENRHEKSVCSGDRMIQLSGLQLCAEIQFPNASMKADAPYFPFTGPASMSLTLHKRDAPNGYKVEAKTIHTPTQTLFRFLSDTPGSEEDRAIGLDVTVKKSEKTLVVDLASPWAALSFNGNLINNANVKGITGRLLVDKEREYVTDLKVQIERTQDRLTYTPTATIQIPKWKTINLAGTVNYQLKKKLDVDLTLTGAQDLPVILQTTVLNTDTEVGARGKFNYEDGEGYVMDAVVQKKQEIKKVRSRYTYTPRLYVRTPSEELVELTGRAEYISDKSLRAKATLNKVSKKPFIATVDLTKVVYVKKNRAKYTGKVTVQGPGLVTKLGVNLDSRNWKVIITKGRLDYNIGKGRKDTITLNNKVINKSTKMATLVKMNHRVDSAKNNGYDHQLLVDLSQKKWVTSLDTTLNYGVNMKQKNNKEKMILSVTARHKLRPFESLVNYTADFAFPAKDLHVVVSGGHAHDNKSLDTSIQIQYHPERTVAFGLSLQDKSRNGLPSYAGEFSTVLPNGREMAFAAQFQKTPDKYKSDIELQLQKGRKSRLETELKFVTGQAYEFSANVFRPGNPRLRFAGAVNREPNGFSASGQYSRGNRLYSSSLSGHYDAGKMVKASMDVNVPERHVILVLDGWQQRTERRGLLDIQWDADNNLDSRFLINATFDVTSKDDFEVATTLQYPSRTIEFNIKHSTGDRFITRAQLIWSPKDVLEISWIFRNDMVGEVGRTELSVKFLSPFQHLEELGIELSRINDPDQYQSKASVIWAKGKKILVSTRAKVPMVKENLDLIGAIRTPFAGYESMSAVLKHRLDKDLQTEMAIEWGKRKRIGLDIVGQMALKKRSRNLNGNLELTTPFESLRKFILSGQHSDDSEIYSSKFLLQKDFDKYSMDLDAAHTNDAIKFRNSGTLQINYPGEDVTTTWEVSRSTGNIHTLLDILPSRGNRFRVEFDESHQMVPNRKLSSSFELMVPTEEFREIAINFNHEDRQGYIKTAGSITKDEVPIFSTGVTYERKYGESQLQAHFASPFNEDMVIQASSFYSLMPYRAEATVQWAPYQVITATSTWFHNEFGMLDSSIRISTPFRRFPSIVVKSTRKREDLNWVADIEVDLGVRQKIKLSTLYRFDHIKMTTIALQTPYPQFPGFETSFKLNGSPTNFRGDAALIMAPYLGRTTVDFNWAYYSGTTLSGEFNLNTPFPSYPYMKARVNSDLLGITRVSSLELEYIPTQVIKVDTEYRFTAAETLQGTITVASPFTEADVVAGFTHRGNRKRFNTNAKITCDSITRPVFTEATFSSELPITLTFTMDSPFRGYEDVDFNFKHNGAINDFHTNLLYSTNGEKIEIDSVLKLKEIYEGKWSLTTPVLPFKTFNFSRAELSFSQGGDFPNMQTQVEGWLNEQKMDSNLVFSHSDAASLMQLKVSTPIEDYRNLRAEVSRSGPLHDFTALAEVDYGQLISSNLRHQMQEEYISSRATIKAPMLEDDVVVYLTRTGTPLDYRSTSEVSMGPQYNYSSNSKFFFNMQNVLSVNHISSTTTKGKTDVSSYSLEHKHNFDEQFANMDIHSQIQTSYNEVKMNLEFDFDFNVAETLSAGSQNVNLTFIAGIPYPDFTLNKYTYFSKRERTEGHMIQSTGQRLESPLLLAYPCVETSYAEYDSETRAFKSDYTWSYEGETIHVAYGVDLSQGTANYLTTTPYQGYESFAVDSKYNTDITDFGMVTTVTTSSLDPMWSKLSWTYVSPTDLTAAARFTSGIENFENLQADVEVKQERDVYKPHLKVSWADDKEVTADGTYQLSVENGIFQSGLSLASPFDRLRMVNVQTEHRHYAAPMRARDSALVEYNNKKYLDCSIEISAENKFSGVVVFRSPRPMEFSFTGVNEGESVDADLLINWNKAQPKSRVRMEFRLADTGSFDMSVKDVVFRFSHPARIVGLHGNLKRSGTQMLSHGKFSWDEEAKKETSYDLEINKQTMRTWPMYDGTLKLQAPARSMELSASLQDGAQQKVIDGAFLWDVETDRDRQLNVKVTLSPSDVRKIAQIDVHLPSLNKDLTVRSEVTVNDGTTLWDSQTEISYAPEESKKITVTSAVEDQSREGGAGYSVRWGVAHLYTQTDIQLTSDVQSSQQAASGTVNLHYLTAEQERKTFTFTTELSKQRQTLDMKVSSPGNSAEINGHLSKTRPYTLVVKTARNEKPTWKTAWTVDTLDKTLDASMTYDEDNLDKTIETRAFFPTPTSFTSMTNRVLGSQEVEEGQVSAYLNNTRHLHGHITWRPDMLYDVVRFAADALNRSGSEMTSALADITEEVGDELIAKYEAISQSLSEELSPLTKVLAQEINAIQRQLSNMRRELRRMHKRNDLYLQTLEEVYAGTVQTLLNSYSRSIGKVRNAYAGVQVKIERLTKTIAEYPIQERYSELIDRLSAAIQDCQTKMREEVDLLLEQMSAKMADFSATYAEVVNEVTDKVKGELVALIDELALSPYLEELRKAYEEVLAQYPQLSTLRNVDLKEAMMQVHKAMLVALEKSTLTDKYRVVYAKVKEVLVEQFGDLMENEDLLALQRSYNEIYEQTAWVYEYLDAEVSLQQLLDKLLEKVRQQVMEDFNQLPLGILDLHKSRFTTFDLDNGEIEFDLYLPVPMKNFDQLMRFKLENYIKSLRKLAEKYFPRADFCVWDLIYKFKPIPMNDMVPPFDAYGSVSGTQHYKTFDGKHFEMSGLCSYVLAEDRVDKNFTVVQKYQGGPRNLKRASLVVMTSGKTVELFPDYRVQVDGRPTEMPYVFKKLVVIRAGNQVLLDAGNGLDIIADFANDFHIIGISGWYYGKTAGLLGTYDNEQHNDLMVPGGEVADNLQQFINAWEVASSCRSRRNYASEDGEENEECAAMFEATSSPLRHCFLQVAPETFQHSCDMAPSNLCDVSALYRHSCNKMGISMRTPPSCVKCTSHDDKQFGAGETVRYGAGTDNPVHRSMDVVFVVEERQCNRDVASRLSDMVYQMEEQLTITGMTNNRYSLMAYAGNAVTPHTMEGQIFNEAKKFTMGVESLRFQNLGPYTDPLSAVLQASDLSFRTGVQKTIVLVSCSPCLEASAYSYAALNSVLQTRDITLHVLRQSGFQLTDNRSPKTKIYGIDKSQVFTKQTSRSTDTDLFSDIEIPTDYCASLALQHNGTLFDVSHALTGNVRQQRHYVEILGQHLSQIATATECQECSCGLDPSGTHPMPVCRKCGSRPSSAVQMMYSAAKSTVDAHQAISNKVKDLLTELY